MKIRLIPHQRAEAAWNLALEEAVFLKAKQALIAGEEVQPVVKLYSFDKPSVILGHHQRLAEIDYEFCKEMGVDVTMRTTGGGSVYLGEHDLQYSMILPTTYSIDLLHKINTQITNALGDVGFTPQIKIKDKHPVIRMQDRGFVFDAQRRFKNLLLHHGTTLVDNADYTNMPQALKATPEELDTLTNGNIWLRQLQQVRESELVKAFNKNLPEHDSVVRKDYTNEEIKLAKKLYKEHYTNKEAFGQGNKPFGICYLTSTGYDMENYAEKDE